MLRRRDLPRTRIITSLIFTRAIHRGSGLAAAGLRGKKRHIDDIKRHFERLIRYEHPTVPGAA